MVKKRVRDPEELPDAPAHSADEENDSGSDVSFGFFWIDDDYEG